LKPLILIPARGGSKGVPYKNIKLLNGKPLIHYTIEAARGAFADKFIYVSTDDLEIKSSAEKTGLIVPFVRPAHLATDTASTYEVVLHAITYAEQNQYFPDTLILLQPTSPFRNTVHIQEALKLYDGSCEMVVAVKESASSPYSILVEDEDGYLRKFVENTFTRRQDRPLTWEYNGAIYIIDVSVIKQKQFHEFSKIKKYEMDELTSHDIDTIIDWKVAEIIVDELYGSKPN
jgi:CMP-N,N'-diacetyllegionaminic acid synthase